MRALGIDSSTQSCSAIVIDTQAGRVVAEASVNYGKDLPAYQAPAGFIPDGPDGEVHADPRMWLDALDLLFGRLSEECDLSEVAAVCGAGQQHGSVYLSERWFETVAALDPEKSLAAQIGPCLSRRSSPIWMDGSTAAQCAEIAEAVGGNEIVCTKSGSIAIERFTGPQIRRFHQIDPEAYGRTARIHLVSSFLCSVLSGSDAPIDTGDGAGMNLLDIKAWRWDPDLLAATAPELTAKLPPVVPGDRRAGTVAEYFVRKFGFRPEVPVLVFTGDNPSSLVGMGASRPGKVVVSLGTSDTFFAAMPEAVSDPRGFGHVFGNPSGGSMSLQCFVNGSLAREAVRDRFGYDWTGFTRALESTPAGNDGKRMLPFFRPEISPRTKRGEAILEGGRAFENWDEPEAAVRACIEGQFANMRLRSQWMRLEPELIYLTGGASGNDAIAQVAADIFQARVERLAVSGSVALGAALRAAASQASTSLAELEAAFCRPVEAGRREPRVPAETYSDLLAWVEERTGA